MSETTTNPSSSGTTTMEDLSARGREALHQADDFVRHNPVPMVLGALAVGFMVGLLARPSEPESKLHSLRDQLEESEAHLRSLLGNLSKAAKKKYKKGSSAVQSSVSDAMDAVSDVDLDDYVDPASKWFKKLWRKYVD